MGAGPAPHRSMACLFVPNSRQRGPVRREAPRTGGSDETTPVNYVEPPANISGSDVAASVDILPANRPAPQRRHSGQRLAGAREHAVREQILARQCTGTTQPVPLSRGPVGGSACRPAAGRSQRRCSLKVDRVIKRSVCGRNDDVGGLHRVSVTFRPSEHPPCYQQYRHAFCNVE